MLSQGSTERDDLADRAIDRIQQRALHNQVVERVGRQAQLGIDQQVDVRVVRPARLVEDRLDRAGQLGAARVGHHAEGAELVAALLDREESGRTARRGIAVAPSQRWFGRIAAPRSSQIASKAARDMRRAAPAAR